MVQYSSVASSRAGESLISFRSVLFPHAAPALELEPLKRTLRESAAQPLEQISLSLQRTARQHGTQSDDQTMLIVRRLPLNRESAT
jgi:hypothetical protein